MNLYDRTLAAESAVSTYRSVNIDEWIAAIDPVLAAAGECAISSDHVDDLTVSAETLTICTSYSVRCCPQTNTMSIPISIVKADDPIKSANHYRINNALSEAKTRLAGARRTLTECTKKVALLEAELAAMPLG